MPLKKRRVERVSDETEVTKEPIVSAEPVVESSVTIKKETIKHMVVTAGLLNLRKSPDINSEVLTRFLKDTKVDVEDISAGWAHIVAPKAGYAAAEFLK